ncbi:MAG: transposase [Bacillota bacterium]|jgi:hypothetical protein
MGCFELDRDQGLAQCSTTPRPLLITPRGSALADRLAPVEDATREQIRQAPVVHCDETGIRIGDRLYRLHAASTATETIYTPHPRRGRPALDEMGILSGSIGTAVHDAWSPYFSYPKVHHALSGAHHLRELTALAEQGQSWAQEMIHLLIEIKSMVEQTRNRTSHLEPAQCQVLSRGWAQNPSTPDRQKGQRGRPKKTKAQNLLERLEKHRPAVLAFMYDFRIPFDNKWWNATCAWLRCSRRSPVPSGAWLVRGILPHSRLHLDRAQAGLPTPGGAGSRVPGPAVPPTPRHPNQRDASAASLHPPHQGIPPCGPPSNTGPARSPRPRNEEICMPPWFLPGWAE